ncbi:MAG: ABC transporter ATP-binding protein [Pseudanabaenaceae cyanobacterium bins.68]|nr:ABC transporter ATP-binding protein [Pseudanabaenaceae cyanobacterium bins.68]
MATPRAILNYFSPYRRAAFFSISASCIFEVIDLVVPYAIGQILNLLAGTPIDPVLQNLIFQVSAIVNFPPDRQLSLMFLLGMIFLVTVVRAPIQPWIGPWWHWEIALRARRDQTKRAIAKILTLPLEFYDQNNPGRIAGRVARGLSNHTWSYPEVAGQLIPKLARVTAIFTMICLIDWRISAIFAVSFGVILTFTFRRLQYLISKEEILDHHQENTESRTSEIITNIKTVKAFANEAKEMKRQSDRIEREFKAVIFGIHVGYVRLGMQQRTMVQSCVFFILSLTLVNTLQGAISLGQFITILTISSMAYSELEPISTLMEVFARRYASMLRFHEMMALEPGSDAKDASLQLDHGYPSYQFKGKLEFSNLSFGYDPNQLVLDQINLKVQPCQTLALVGRSGSGKSTLVKLLFRYFEPTQGKILIDGQNIAELNITGYRKRLAIVHQEVDVFNGTLLENLVYGNPKATLAEVEEACAIARVDEFLHLLPKGFYTIVGERGMRLSGGQRQRLGIARALLVNPDILVFDEATSSLDYESERAIQLAMAKIQGTRTTIIIAHRLSTVREADQIVVLDRGQIAEIGTHQDLLSKGGIYHRLHALQESGELV